MKYLTTVALALGIAFSGAAFAQEKQEGAKQAPSAAQKKQQARMRDCNERAGGRQGRERQEFMARCLKAAPAKSAKMTEQQNRMARCNRQASAKGMKGDDRQRFMSGCLKG